MNYFLESLGTEPSKAHLSLHGCGRFTRDRDSNSLVFFLLRRSSIVTLVVSFQAAARTTMYKYNVGRLRGRWLADQWSPRNSMDWNYIIPLSSLGEPAAESESGVNVVLSPPLEYITRQSTILPALHPSPDFITSGSPA